ncbi:hypothetical protein IL306_012316 [Fusarium sp. DS 682]|nr:hypothetical protein IL306_012316 [Fusarium sp. DS 682]
MEWDELVPALPLQRQLLHINIYSFVSINFRGALMQDTSQDRYLPPYKQVLLSSQLSFLASVALKALDCTHTLHAMMGGSQTRCPVLITTLFEMALILACLSARPDAPGNNESHRAAVGENQIGISTEAPTQERCMQALHKALEGLQMLADVSDMAEIGARRLEELMSAMTEEVAELKCNPPEPASDDLIGSWDWQDFPQDMALNLDLNLDTIFCQPVGEEGETTNNLWSL